MYKNYKLIKEQELIDINSYGELLSHEKSGAKILLLKNSDENKSFCIGFRTPPYDDTGLPHILEHSVLCGSRKFPVKEPFVELMKSSLNTFLNAMTFPDKTIYPVASCNDKDFRNLMDVYMDAVLYPNIHTKEEIFKQEGWHYELDSKDGELIYNGVVYNEMKGAFSSPDGILGRESLNSLFPDTAYGVESGGNPEFIPTLTYEKFKEFHKKYYHPSNSYITIYGNCDMEDTLKFIDEEYLSKFDKIEVDSTLEVQKPFSSLKEKKVLYPVSKEQGTENKTLMSYNVALPEKTSPADLMALDIITEVLLLAPGAPLVMALLGEKIGDVVTGSFDSGVLQPVFSIISKNTNESEKEKFVKVIEEKLNSYVKEGLNKKALQAAINSYEFKLREADFGGMSKGLIYTINAYNTWLYDDLDPFSTFDFSKYFGFLKQQLETNYFEEIIEKYLINNTHKALVMAVPSVDVQEEKEKALKEKLANYKASLTDEEIEGIIKSTKELKEYQAAPDTQEGLATIPLLKKEDLSYDVLNVSNNLEEINGVKSLHHDYATNGIGYIRLLFNLKNMPKEYVPYLGIYKTLIASLDTEKHTYQTLGQDIDINTGGITESIMTYSKKDGCGVELLIKANTLYDKIGFTFDIIKEIIETTNFDMKDRVKECLNREVAKMQQVLVGAGHQKSLNRSMSYYEESAYYTDLVDGIGYFDVLSDLVKSYDEKYQELVETLKDMTQYIFTKENLLLSFTGNNEGYKVFKEEVSKFVQGLKDKATEKEKFVFVPNKLNEGFKAPIDVQYVAVSGNYKKANLEYTGSLQVFQNIVSTYYLWKNVRVLGGAYGCMCGFAQSGVAFFVSYRDPNLTKTLDTYKGVVNYINEFNATEEEMTKYIIGAVGSYDFPKSPSNKGGRALTSYLVGLTEEDYKKEKAQIIDTKLEDIKNIAKYIETILEQNNVCVIGNDKKVEEAKEIFKETKMLFK